MSNKRRRAIDKKRSKKANEDIMAKRSRRIISFVVASCAMFIGVSSFNMFQQYQSYNYVIKELEEQYEEELKRTQEILEYEDYTQTDEYVEEVAKDKLGMIYPDEMLIIAQ